MLKLNLIVFTTIFSTRIIKQQNKKFLSQLKEAFHDFALGGKNQVSVTKNETIGRQKDDFPDNSGFVPLDESVVCHKLGAPI